MLARKQQLDVLGCRFSLDDPHRTLAQHRLMKAKHAWRCKRKWLTCRNIGLWQRLRAAEAWIKPAAMWGAGAIHWPGSSLEALCSPPIRGPCSATAGIT